MNYTNHVLKKSLVSSEKKARTNKKKKKEINPETKKKKIKTKVESNVAENAVKE